ncbi:MAG: FtsW/RodA/SpoVE family cell cycle protein, partial [Acidimicrobiales bacterium]
GLALLLMPLVPKLGQNINGARLWVRLGPVSFQPVELGKLALVIFFASYFVEKRELLTLPTARIGNRLVTDPRPFGPVVLAWAFSLVVMTAEHDIGFSLLLFVIFISLLWVTTGRVLYLVVGAVLFALGALVAAHLFGQVHERIAVWLDPWRVSQTTGYQIVQGQYALGTGGIAGSGLGLGQPGLIPVVTSDFIFAAFGEELGLVGTTFLVGAYVVLVGAGMRIALKCRSDFAKLLTVGFTALLGFQAFFIMAGVVRLLPLTGVTLPFVAYGGSSLVANYVLIAILMRISNEAAEWDALGPPHAESSASSTMTGTGSR